MWRSHAGFVAGEYSRCRFVRVRPRSVPLCAGEAPQKGRAIMLIDYSVCCSASARAPFEAHLVPLRGMSAASVRCLRLTLTDWSFTEGERSYFLRFNSASLRNDFAFDAISNGCASGAPVVLPGAGDRECSDDEDDD